ncbi:MAG: AIR synthase related protein, partial [Elusimicrobia bacterium]|nr:AIR synthase related protein [Elusimicrobiota bacterium]
MQIKDVGEFGFIKRFSPKFLKNLPRDVVGIGDDCAVIPTQRGLSILVTADMLIEGIHFIKQSISAFDLGQKSLAVNLSDIAAMGGEPKYYFLSIALPPSVEVGWLDNFFEGLYKISCASNVHLLGGDTT